METKRINYTLPIVCLCAFLLLDLAGCSGSGGSAQNTTLKTGVFLDSTVDGLEYIARTPSGEVVASGVTADGGKFLYKDGEIISFHVGDITLGETFANVQVTPVDLVPGAYNETNDKVTNIARLLQSLDLDGQPENGITITEPVRSGCRGKSLHMVLDPAASVEGGLAEVMQGLNGRGLFQGAQARTLRTSEEAQTHMRDTLAKRDKEVRRGSMATFRDRQELEAYFREQYASRLLPIPVYGGSMGVAAPAAAPTTAQIAITAGSSGDVQTYSTTNLQEAGVDESDLVKNDGQYLYVAGSRNVTISKIFPADGMQVTASVEVKGTVDSLYLYKQTLVVLYRPNGSMEATISSAMPMMVGCPWWIPPKARTGVLMVNVADPSRPATVLDFVADGYLVSSRITGGKLHLVQQYLPQLPVTIKQWYDGTEEDRKKVVDTNRQAVAALTIKDFIPSYTTYDATGQAITSGSLIEPENFYRPPEPEGGSIVAITTFRLDAPNMAFTSAGTVADAGTVYASPNSLYLAATRWAAMQSSPSGFEETVIHKFDLSGEAVAADGTATVKGRLLNQYSLGEYDGVLRVATTTGSVGGGIAIPVTTVPVVASTSPAPTVAVAIPVAPVTIAPLARSANHVFCLRATDGVLQVIGTLENLAPGESIYAARFIGPRGFLVTFKKIDPLFTLDLSDPTSPKVAGVLKVPGYSDYLHLLDANHLLAVGKDAKPDPRDSSFGWYQGMQLSIFDISDFANPTLLHKELIGVRGTNSEALVNPKAFTFLPEQNLLAFPVSLAEYLDMNPAAHGPSDYGSIVFNGLYVYRVTPIQGFEFLGRITTDSKNWWTRGVFIDRTAYAVQQNSVRSASTDNISAPGFSLGW
jgi:inhibitor of cysteine peptidase